ncbi:adducin-related protein C1289.14 [Caerostris darwini]|uniref:Adducin-related protein C1289.14 n=1 Tax=Caerostris darwini TaxID=1538125 RepID=A0AAV4QH28_9ARAC|nr:adducin-related protein C1289.14 [Caerostris darwini]
MLLTKLHRPCRIVTHNFSKYNSFSTDKRSINKEIRFRLASAYRGLDSYGLNEGVCNHLSAIAPSSKTDEDIMLIIPFNLHWSEVTPSCLLEINNKNEVIVGEGEPETTALCIHKGIYERRSDVKAVMHTHMPYATALTCLKEPQLLMLHQNSARFYKKIAYDTIYHGLGDSFKEGLRLGEVLEDKSVLFMGNHGILTVAESVDVAFDNMYYLERAAMIQVLACSTQQKLKILDDNVAELTYAQMHKVLPAYAKNHLDSVIRRLMSSCKDFL